MNEQTIRDEWNKLWEYSTENIFSKGIDFNAEHAGVAKYKIADFWMKQLELARGQGILAGRQQACAEVWEKCNKQIEEEIAYYGTDKHGLSLADIAQIIGIKDEA